MNLNVQGKAIVANNAAISSGVAPLATRNATNVTLVKPAGSPCAV